MLQLNKQIVALALALMGGTAVAADADAEPKRTPLGVNQIQEPGESKKLQPVTDLPQDSRPAATAAEAPAAPAQASQKNAKKGKGAKTATASAEAVAAPAAAQKAAEPKAATAQAPAEPKPVAETKPAVASTPAPAAAPASAPPAKTAAAPAAGGKDTTDAARQALAKQEGDKDNKKLAEDVLTSQEKNYTLLKKGSFDFSYDFNYSYISADRLDYAVASNSQNQFNISKFGLERDATHTVTNTITGDYGLRDNLTVGVSVPLVYKYDSSNNLKRWVTGIGDLSLNTRWQPIEVSRRMPSLTINGSVRAPTGISPYEIIAGKELSTGSGYWGGTVSGNLSKVIDPVVLFGSLGYSYNLKKTGLNQVRGNEGRRISAIEPGSGFNVGAGFGYALSYDIALNLSTQVSWSKQSQLIFHDGTSVMLDMETSGSMNFGLTWRLDPKFTLGFTAAIGLTNESPDFSFGVNMPLNF